VKHLHAVGHFMERVEGRPVFIGAIQDVTQSAVAEEALARARAEITHMSRVSTLGALTASIAHEVNQPLSGITINAGTCLRRLAADPPNLDGALVAAERTLRDAERMSEVIQRLRSLFSRNQPTNEPVDLNDATREVLALSSGELQRGGVIVQTELPDQLPAGNGDRVQLQQVILNLVLNAIDAMKAIDDRPRHLIVATASEEVGWLRLSVADCGVGINFDRAEELFNAFYTTKSRGMGLGLSVSRSIIESHGGSALGDGEPRPRCHVLILHPVQA
jgi:C4-dicarboxylate-specific signal transduction histidine kinase